MQAALCENANEVSGRAYGELGFERQRASATTERQRDIFVSAARRLHKLTTYLTWVDSLGDVVIVLSFARFVEQANVFFRY